MTHRADNQNDIFEHDVLVRGNLTASTISGSGSIMPIGSILMYGSASAPANFLDCDGAEISRTTYSKLFAVIGTTFGVGNGTTTFNIPNMNDNFAIGKFSNSIGATGGSTGTADGYASVSDSGHTHILDTGSVILDSSSVGQFGSTTATDYANVQDSGHNHAFAPPFLALSFIIKYQ